MKRTNLPLTPRRILLDAWASARYPQRARELLNQLSNDDFARLKGGVSMDLYCFARFGPEPKTHVNIPRLCARALDHMDRDGEWE